MQNTSLAITCTRQGAEDRCQQQQHDFGSAVPGVLFCSSLFFSCTFEPTFPALRVKLGLYASFPY
jgi:hypothetical protein